MYDYLAKIILLGPSGSGKCVGAMGMNRVSADGYGRLDLVCCIGS
jgi:hypothetical protein